MFVALAWILATATPIAVPADDDVAALEDLRQLQGVWQMEIKREGETLRVQLENRGNRQTLSSYRDGQLVHEHTVEFGVSRMGELKVFRWKNGENTFGTRKGKAMPDGGFVYRVKDGRWTTVSGLLSKEEDQPIITQQFQKTGE